MYKLPTPLLVLLLAVVVALSLVGCIGDPIDNLYTSNLYPGSNNTYNIGSPTLMYDTGYFRRIHADNITGNITEIDPVFIASPASAITGADILGWNAHPPLTTGTHGVAGTIVGTSDAQALTNKQITMNNNTPIYWKDTLGAVIEVFNVWLDNNLSILEGEHRDIFVWLSSGTGHKITFWPTGSTAGSTLQDSPTIVLNANYWDTTNKNWAANIIHNMITAGATPKSRLEFEIQGEDIIRLENDTGVTKTYVTSNFTSILQLSAYGNNAAAVAGGLVAGDLYRTGGDPDLVCVVH